MWHNQALLDYQPVDPTLGFVEGDETEEALRAKRNHLYKSVLFFLAVSTVLIVIVGIVVLVLYLMGVVDWNSGGAGTGTGRGSTGGYSSSSTGSGALAPVLDSLSTGVVYGAYSLRRLSSAASWAIQVQLANQTLVHIGFASDGTLDIASLLALCQSSTVTIELWHDQTNQQDDLLQTQSANQPVICSNGVIAKSIGGYPAVRFLPSAQTLLTTSGSVVGYVSSVVNRDAGNQGAVLGQSYLTNWESTNTPTSLLFNSYNNHCEPSICLNGVITVNGTRSTLSGTQIPWPPGNSIFTIQPLTNNTNTGWGNIGQTYGTPTYLQAYYMELVVYTSAPSAADQSKLLSNQLHYYGFSSS